MMFQQDKYINLFLIKQIFFNKFYKISKTLFNKCLSYFWQNINDSTKTNYNNMTDFDNVLKERLSSLSESKQENTSVENTNTEQTTETNTTQEVVNDTPKVDTNTNVVVTPKKSVDTTTNVVVTPEASVETKEVSEPKVTKKYSNEQVEEIDAYFKKNPDKSLDDYLRLKRPIDSISNDELIKEFLSEKEGMTEAEIKLEMKRMEVKQNADEDDEFDLDEYDEVKRLEAQALLEKRLREAKAWKEQSVSEQLTFEKETSVQEDIPAREQVISEYEKWRADEMRKATEEYYTTAFQSLNELQGFEVDINGETVLLDVDDALKTTIKQSLDTTTIVKQFFDEKGKLVNTKDYFEALAWFNKDSREKLLQERDRQVEARVKAETAKVRKNITLNNRQTVDVDVKPDVTNIRDYVKKY